MANGISGSGGVDSSSLDYLLGQLNNILSKQSEINNTKLNPKADGGELKNINKQLSELRENINKTERTNIELFNTKAVQRKIHEAQDSIDNILKRIDNSTDQMSSDMQKSFIENFKVLELFGKRFGENLVSEYQDIFKKLTNINVDSSNFYEKRLAEKRKQNIDSYIQSAERNATSVLSGAMFDAPSQANDKIYEVQRKQLLEQKRIIEESINLSKQAQLNKKNDLIVARDALVNSLISEIKDLRSVAGDDQFLDIDENQFAKFTKSAYDLLQIMSEMGVETREFEDVLLDINNKVRIPKDVLDNMRKSVDTSELEKAQQKIEELLSEVDELKKKLDDDSFGDFSGITHGIDSTSEDVKELYDVIDGLRNEISDLEMELYHSVDQFSWNQKCEEVARLELEIDNLNRKIKDLSFENDFLNADNNYLSSLERVEHEASNTSDYLYSIDVASDEAFSIDDLNRFSDILARIEEHLRNIAQTLGSVDDNSSFKNIISSVEVLLERLDEMYEKIGSGITNVDMRIGSGYGSAGDKLLADERQSLREQYKKVVKRFGGESNLYTELANVLNANGMPSSIDDLLATYGEGAINKIDSDKTAINRLKTFFEQLSLYRQFLEENVHDINEELQRQQQSLRDNNVFVGEVNRFINKHDSSLKLKHDYKTTEKTTKQERESRLEELERRIEENDKQLQQLRELSEFDKFAESDIDERVAEINKAERDSIMEMQEKAKVDLINVIEQLERIETLLTEINNKDFLGETFTVVSSKLDEIVSKFDAIIADVKIINDNPILTNNESSLKNGNTQLSIVDAQANEIKELTEAYDNEQRIVKETVSSEESVLVSLLPTIDSIIAKIEEKNRMWQEEGQIVEGVVQNEITNLEVLSGSILNLKEDIKRIVVQDDEGLFKIDENQINAIVESLTKFANSINNIKIDDSFLKPINELLNKQNELEKLADILSHEKREIEAVATAVNQVQGKPKSKSNDVDELNEYIAKLKELNKYKANQLSAELSGNGIMAEHWASEIDKANESLKQYDSSLSQTQEAIKENVKLEQKLAQIRAQNNQKAENDNKKQEAAQDNMYKKRIDWERKIQQWRRQNSAAEKTFGPELDELTMRLRNGSNMLDDELTQIVYRFKEIQSEAYKTGQAGSSVFNMIKQRAKSMIATLTTFNSFYDVIRVVRQGYTYVADINKQMVELSKVSGQTLGQIQNDFEEYANTAKDLGATISDTISATADWSRLGYSVPDAKELARVALLYKNVGDGIDIGTANESLISTLQGYQMQADQAEHIVDVFNEVANNYAIDSAGIGEALQRSAASLNAANTSLEESVALVTAANTVVQNPEQVGTVFKTLSARIRGASTELEDLGEEADEFTETTSKLQGLVKSLTGFDILEADQKTFKSIYDILIGIGKEWKNLDDIERASLGEALAGKRNANALYAVLDNIETLEAAYNTAENSAGSAMREQENFEQGLEYSTNRLKASLEELATGVLDSGFLKGLIDTGNNILGIVNDLISSFGTLKTLIAGIGTFVLSNKFSKLGYIQIGSGTLPCYG